LAKISLNVCILEKASGDRDGLREGQGKRVSSCRAIGHKSACFSDKRYSGLEKVPISEITGPSRGGVVVEIVFFEAHESERSLKTVIEVEWIVRGEAYTHYAPGYRRIVIIQGIIIIRAIISVRVIIGLGIVESTGQGLESSRLIEISGIIGTVALDLISDGQKLVVS
jgi:hypothetical protein